MIDRTANLLGAVGLAVNDRIEEVALEVLNRAGETPAALVVIGYDWGPSNEQLRRVLRLSHPGSVRLVDRLVSDGLVERQKASDRRAVALHLTAQGKARREALLTGRLAVMRSLIEPLTNDETEAFASLLHKVLSSLEPTQAERRTLCRLCDRRLCGNCPIPA